MAVVALRDLSGLAYPAVRLQVWNPSSFSKTTKMVESQIDLALPYATAEYAGIGGALRARPEYFEVTEIPLYEASGDGEHLFVSITKVNLTTKQVQEGLARLFGLKRMQIGVAGLKDKHARTTQTFSLHIGRRDAVFVEDAAHRIADGLDVEVHWARFHRNKLKTGHLLGNEFSIVVSNPDCALESCIERCEVIAGSLLERGMPNYFGSQRLGRNGSNVQQGLGILGGDVSRSDRWLRKFLVGSVQSYLCNRYLAERVQAGLFDQLVLGDVAKKYATGGMFEVEDLDAEQPRYAAHEISFTAPLFGPKMWPAKAESGAFEESILDAAGLSAEDFGRLRVEGTRRLGRLLVGEINVTEHSEGVCIQFGLPKGAYATTVLREFMKAEDELDISDSDSSLEVDNGGS